MRTFISVMIVLVLIGAVNAVEQVDPSKELRQHLGDTRWQWDGGGGEVVVFGENGYIEHEEWTRRGLVTRWNVIDRRTVLLRIERGRMRDLYAVLTFNDNITAYDGFNFHGGARLKTSTRLTEQKTERIHSLMPR